MGRRRVGQEKGWRCRLGKMGVEKVKFARMSRQTSISELLVSAPETGRHIL